MESALGKFTRRTDLIDGTKIVAGSAGPLVKGQIQSCESTLKSVEGYYARVSSKGRATDRAKKARAEVDALAPWCKTFATAGTAYVATAVAAEKQTKDLAAASDAMCRQVLKQATDATHPYLDHTLDVWRGARTLIEPAEMTSFRERLMKLAPICARPEHKTVITSCAGTSPAIHASETNMRYTVGDICRMAADPTQALTDAATRLIAFKDRGQDAPTLELFRRQEGWVQDTKAAAYVTYFTVGDDKKQELMGQVKVVFDAAGVPVPKDLSALWAKRQAYLDALKVVVDATRSEWKIGLKACKGYACDVGKKSITRAHPNAKIKKVYAYDWDISKNDVNIPTERFQSLLVLFQLPGDAGCQVRQLTAYEPYKGGGKYQAATGTTWGFVRFQRCS